jgi:MSHA biogenesis protein MshK
MAANMMKYFASFVIVSASVVTFSAWGQVLSDPTRPPFGIDDAAPAASAYPRVRGLQSVIISPTHCAAIIDGKTVELGAQHGSERLIEITARGVVMQGEGGRRALTLFPAVGVKITEALSLHQQAAKCNLEQIRQAKKPVKQAGQKENK